MPTVDTVELKAHAAVEALISNAKLKLRAGKDSELCPYLPGSDGMALHHFTFEKLRKTNPEQLATLIKQHILDAKSPEKCPGRPREKRAVASAHRSKSGIEFSQSELATLIELLKSSGKSDLLEKVAKHRDNFSEARRDLMESIKQRKLQPELWEAYAAACQVRGIEPSLAAIRN